MYYAADILVEAIRNSSNPNLHNAFMGALMNRMDDVGQTYLAVLHASIPPTERDSICKHSELSLDACDRLTDIYTVGAQDGPELSEEEALYLKWQMSKVLAIMPPVYSYEALSNMDDLLTRPVDLRKNPVIEEWLCDLRLILRTARTEEALQQSETST